jgi:ribosome-associated protein
MKPADIRDRKLEKEFIFSASRSSGPGGQNVNKVNTRIELRFNVTESLYLSESEKQLIFEKLAKRINSEGELVLVSQSERSQRGNRERAIERFYNIIAKALTRKPGRIPTSPTPASVLKRIESKKKRAQIKKLRKLPE